MNFRRTTSGIGSMHLFFGVDAVVYCEGGGPVAVAALLSGAGEEGTFDIAYWKIICAALAATRRYHFKSVGSKQVLKSIADDVVQANLTAVVVCMDGDFDVLRGREVRDPRVVYTFGYSWESDVVRAPVVRGVLASLLPVDAETVEICDNFERDLGRIATEIARWGEVDLALIAQGKGALFVRSSPLALYDLSSIRPAIDLQRLRGRLGSLGYRRAPPRKIKFPDSDSLRYVFGKTVAKAVYHLTVGWARSRDQQINLNYDLFLRLCMAETRRALADGRLPSIVAYFNGARAAFT